MKLLFFLEYFTAFPCFFIACFLPWCVAYIKINIFVIFFIDIYEVDEVRHCIYCLVQFSVQYKSKGFSKWSYSSWFTQHNKVSKIKVVVLYNIVVYLRSYLRHKSQTHLHPHSLLHSLFSLPDLAFRHHTKQTLSEKILRNKVEVTGSLCLNTSMGYILLDQLWFSVKLQHDRGTKHSIWQNVKFTRKPAEPAGSVQCYSSVRN